MATTKHTPGPWDWKQYRGTRYEVFAANPYKKSKYAMIVADVEARAKDNVTQAVAIANAQLIATAPHMIKLLERILGMHDTGNCGAYNGEAILSQSVADEIRWTIARAEGREAK